jgi:hypothetical protein
VLGHSVVDLVEQCGSFPGDFRTLDEVNAAPLVRISTTFRPHTAEARGLDLPSSVTKVVRLLREEGLGRLAMVSLRLATSPLLGFGRVVFFLRELDGQWSTPRAPAGISVRLASLPELPRLVAARPPDAGLVELFRQRFRRGDWCVVAVEKNGTVAHSRWVSTLATLIPELNMEIRLRSGEAYLYDGSTRPDARGRGIDGVVRCFVFDKLRATGLNRVYSYCRGDNRPALRAANRWQTPVGEMWFLRLRGLGAWVIRRRERRRTVACAGPAGLTAQWPLLARPSKR